MGTEGGATIGWDVIDHFKVNGLKKKKKNPRLPFGRQRGSFPRPARFCSPRLPSSGARRGGLGSLVVGPGTPGSSRLHRSSFTQPAAGLLREDRAPRAQTRARAARRVRFSLSQQAGKACSPGQLKAAGLEAPGSGRKPELPATGPAKRGGGEPSKLPRRPAVRIPEEKPLWQKPKASAPPPSFDLASSCLGTALLSPHLRPGPGPSPSPYPIPSFSSISSLTFLRPGPECYRGNEIVLEITVGRATPLSPASTLSADLYLPSQE